MACVRPWFFQVAYRHDILVKNLNVKYLFAESLITENALINGKYSSGFCVAQCTVLKERTHF